MKTIQKLFSKIKSCKSQAAFERVVICSFLFIVFQIGFEKLFAFHFKELNGSLV